MKQPKKWKRKIGKQRISKSWKRRVGRHDIYLRIAIGKENITPRNSYDKRYFGEHMVKCRTCHEPLPLSYGFHFCK